MLTKVEGQLTSLWEGFSKRIDPVISGILDRALDGHEISAGEGIELFNAKGADSIALTLVADELRRRSVGDLVTFVVNRNINYTNICYIGCKFCSFAKPEGDPEAWFYPVDEVVRRAKEAKAMGATEVCIQGGLHPYVDPFFYADICKAIKKEIPDMHVHAFSPWEIVFGSRKAHMSYEEYLKVLKEAGLGTMPGTAAEILVDEVREIISPNKITVKTWVEVIKAAHKLGIPTSSTIMYGHVDGPEHWVEHLALLRDIQKETHGFTEFVPLSFVHNNTELYKSGIARAGATGHEDVKMYAVSRILLHNHIDNIQVSWVKLGRKFSEVCLDVGCNDFGGTLINESISRMAGCTSGQYVPPEDFVTMIKGAGRIPAQRSTTYRILKIYD